jgi:phytoene dehydrogenase-like protein
MIEKYDSIIIGAGIGGLVCAALLAKNGLKVVILDKEEQAGGYCRSFSCEGFTFDACIDSIGGLRKNEFLHKTMQSLGVLDKIQLIAVDPIRRNIFPDFTIDIPAGVEEYKHTLKSLFPKQSSGIDKVFCLMENIFEDSVASVLNVSTPTQMYYWVNRSFKELLDDHIDDIYLQAALSSYCNFLGLPASEVSAIAAACALIHYLKGGTFRVRGGIQKLINAIIETINCNNGKVVLGTEVAKINFTDNRPSGIETVQGEIFNAKYIISNIDAKTLTGSLIGRDILPDDKIEAIEALNVSSSLIIMYLGVNCTLSHLGLIPSIGYFSCFDTDAMLNKDERISFGVSIPSIIDDTLAPKGHSSVLVHWPCYRGWERFYDRNITESAFMGYAERIIPDLSKHVIFKKIADPKTFFKYTGNAGGSAYGWEQKPGFLANASLFNDLPNNLKIVGHWAGYGGGIMPSVLSAVKVANDIIK